MFIKPRHTDDGYHIHFRLIAVMTSKITDGKLHVAGFIYYKSKSTSSRPYWECREVKQKQYTARAITNVPVRPEDLALFKGPAESTHSHPPNVDESAAVGVTARLQRLATDQPNTGHAQILRTELVGLFPGVLSQLPEQEALSKVIRQARKKQSPPNPQRLNDLGDLPHIFI